MIKTFLNSESGAVTVDWVVLTAAIVGLGLAVMAVVSAGVEDLSNDIDAQLTGQGISTDFGATTTQPGDTAIISDTTMQSCKGPRIVAALSRFQSEWTKRNRLEFATNPSLRPNRAPVDCDNTTPQRGRHPKGLETEPGARP